MPKVEYDVPRVRTFVGCADLTALVRTLHVDGSDVVWLDSARVAYDSGRFSIVAATSPQERVTFSAASGAITRDGTVIAADTSIWDWLAADVAARPVTPGDTDIPFWGGWIGYIGYGTPGRDCAPRADPTGRDAELVAVSRFVVVDHELALTHVIHVSVAGDVADGELWSEGIGAALQLKRPVTTGVPEAKQARTLADAVAMSVTRDEYLAALATVQGWLLDGDSYEACFTYAASFPAPVDPFAAYGELRARNPAPFGAYLRFSDRVILSSSPERFLRVELDGRAQAKPIKGTAARHPDPVTDAAIAAELAADPKNRSENLMIVDLLRNDLGLISEPGSVTVPRLMEVESYATVHQLVSTIESRLREHPAAAVNAARALFPPGSMTGAPKVRTVALLDALEGEPRGPYAGALGWFSRCGAAELSVVIRTTVIDGEGARLGTGGAITVQSLAAQEWNETVTKAQSVLAAWGLRHPGSELDPDAGGGTGL